MENVNKEGERAMKRKKSEGESERCPSAVRYLRLKLNQTNICICIHNSNETKYDAMPLV